MDNTHTIHKLLLLQYHYISTDKMAAVAPTENKKAKHPKGFAQLPGKYNCVAV